MKAACDYRRFVMNRPGTDSCRLIYGEADRLPGVIADRFGGVIVLQVLALGMERFTQTIADALLACEKPDCLLLQNDDAIRRKEGMECFTRVLYGTLPEENIIHENGVKLAVDVLGGQKTGYFLDQKDNHLFVRQFCKDARVLDCFSYIGAFALNAAAAGAKEVTAVDISEAAVQLIEKNAALNGADITAVCANCFDFLRAQVKAGEKIRRGGARSARVHQSARQHGQRLPRLQGDCALRDAPASGRAACWRRTPARITCRKRSS